MGSYRWLILGFTLSVAQGTSPDARANDKSLRLETELLTRVVVERTPVVALLRIRNTSVTSVNTIFSLKYPHLLADRAFLMLEDAARKTYLLNYRGGPLSEEFEPIAVYPLAPDEIIEVDRVVSLIFLPPLPPRWAGRVNERYEFLKPGVYTGHFEVALLGSEKLVSEEFELTILEAQGVDAKARDGIRFRHLGFLEGRDAASNASLYDGRKWHKKVDVSRFGELQKILDDYPDSAYAEWIRFWKVYHHGSEEEALQYARSHRDFPLSDDLMLRVIQRVANSDARHDRAVELLKELDRVFPNGNATVSAKALRRKLQSKRRR